MHVIDVPGVIDLVTYHMLPKAPLPYTSLPLFNPHLRTPLGARKRLHEAYLDRLPAIGKIVISRRQGPHAMHIVK